MAVEAITVGTEKTVDVAKQAYERSVEVMKRQWSTYDHEKVFWNSAWTVGIIGLGYIAVQLGKAISGFVGTAGGVIKFFTDQPANSYQTGFFNTVDYIEGDKKNVDVPPGWIGYYALKQMQDAARQGDFTLYEAYKQRMFSQWLQAYPSDERMSLEDQYELWKKSRETKQNLGVDLTPGGILDLLDRFYGEYGPIMPFAAVAGHMGLESLRVYRIRKGFK